VNSNEAFSQKADNITCTLHADLHTPTELQLKSKVIEVVYCSSSNK